MYTLTFECTKTLTYHVSVYALPFEFAHIDTDTDTDTHTHTHILCEL